MRTQAIWAIISTYRPERTLLEALRAIQPQVSEVVVVDDGTPGDEDAVLDELIAAGAHVLRSAENRGIAAALNRGYAFAREAGADAVLSFDQDSHVAEGFVAQLVDTWNRATERGLRVGAVVPEYFAGVRQSIGDDADLPHAHRIIQSGMLIPVGTLSSLGMMREDLFIDLVDTEFELRAGSSDYELLAAPGTRLEHRLGQQYLRSPRTAQKHRERRVVTLSTPFRYFYRMRNRLVIDRMYWRRFPRRLLRDTLVDLAHFAEAATLARPRSTFLHVLRAGAGAAFRHRMGRIPPAVQQIAADVSWRAHRVDHVDEQPD